jgi:hypothetical protein
VNGYAGFKVDAVYGSSGTESGVKDYDLSTPEGDAVLDTAGLKTITVSVSRGGVTLEKTFTVTVKGETQALKIELVNDKIVNLFGLTTAEAESTTTGIKLSVKGARREVVISLTGYSNENQWGPTNDVTWAIDGGTWTSVSAGYGNGIGNVVTIKAVNYTLGRHWVEFRGTKDGGHGKKVPYSKTFIFTVDID